MREAIEQRTPGRSRAASFVNVETPMVEVLGQALALTV
jgi:hypothetical protein